MGALSGGPFFPPFFPSGFFSSLLALVTFIFLCEPKLYLWAPCRFGGGRRRITICTTFYLSSQLKADSAEPRGERASTEQEDHVCSASNRNQQAIPGCWWEKKNQKEEQQHGFCPSWPKANTLASGVGHPKERRTCDSTRSFRV